MNRQQFAIKVGDDVFSVFDSPDSRTPMFLVTHINQCDPLRSVAKGNPMRLVLDIGAHVGIFSFITAKRYPNAQIVAVEPNPDNAVNFGLGVVENGFKNIQLIPAAIGDGNPVTLHTEFANTGSACEYRKNFRRFPDGYPIHSITAPSIELNELVERIASFHGRPIDFMKVDIEGKEFHVFRDFKYWHYVRQMTVELHPFHAADSKEEAMRMSEEFSDFLKTHMLDKVEIINPDFRELDR